MPNRMNPEPNETPLDPKHFERDFFKFSQDYRDNDHGPMGVDDDYGIHTDQKAHPINPAIEKPHVSAAPRAYKPADDRLGEEVMQALTDDENVDPSDLEIDVVDGKVTLRGTVRTSSMKHAVGDLAEALPGVEFVKNELSIQADLE